MNGPLKLLFGTAMIASTFAACSDSDKKSAADFCTVAKSLVTTQETLDAMFEGSEVPSAAEVEASFGTLISLVNQLADAAPGEISDDMVVVVRGFTALDSAMKSAGYDLDVLFTDPAIAAAAAADLAVFSTPETEAAMDTVDQYSLTECGFALDTSGDGLSS
jgi:catalase (peroxidase I)